MAVRVLRTLLGASFYLLVLLVVFVHGNTKRVISRSLGLNETIPANCFDLAATPMLTFTAKTMTTGANESPIRQMRCVGGNACLYESQISTIQCINEGLDVNNNVEWKCSAHLPSEMKIESPKVSCEGCQSPNDPIKLDGSCGLSYSLAILPSSTNEYYIVAGIIGVVVVVICVAVVLDGSGRFKPNPRRYEYIELPTTTPRSVAQPTQTTPDRSGLSIYQQPLVPSPPPYILVSGMGGRRADSFVEGIITDKRIPSMGPYRQQEVKLPVQGDKGSTDSSRLR
jgi:hypothetical protein